MSDLASFGAFLPGYHATTGLVEDGPFADAEVVLCLKLTVASDLEPSWTLISDRASQQGLVMTLAWKDRMALAPTRIGALADYNFGAGAKRYDQCECRRADTPSGVIDPRNREESAVRSAELCLGVPAPPADAAAATLLSELREIPNVRVHRPAILYGVLKALRGASAGNVLLAEAARLVRDENRLLGRPLPKRAVSSTLLLKRLEAEVAVVLNTEGMSAQHLYVAMTRGSMKLVVCSASPILG